MYLGQCDGRKLAFSCHSHLHTDAWLIRGICTSLRLLGRLLPVEAVWSLSPLIGHRILASIFDASVAMHAQVQQLVCGEVIEPQRCPNAAVLTASLQAASEVPGTACPKTSLITKLCLRPAPSLQRLLPGQPYTAMHSPPKVELSHECRYASA